MMIFEVLDFNARQLTQNIAAAYLPVLPKFITYFESCIKKTKATEQKPFKGFLGETLYPVSLKSKNVKGLVIKTQTRSYLITYQLTNLVTEVCVYPFNDQRKEDIHWTELYKGELPTYKQLFSADKRYFCLSRYSTQKGSKVIIADASNYIRSEEHSRFLSTLEFVCIGLVESARCKPLSVPELYDNFKFAFDKYQDHH